LAWAGGYDNEDASPDMTFEQLQRRVNWRATDKISFQLHDGVEDRQFLSGGAAHLINPVFGDSVQYQPFEQTKISLTGEWVVAAYYLQNNQVTESTGVSAGLNQRLVKKLSLDLNGGYQLIKYVSSVSTPGPNRKDNSSLPGYSFTSHQVGFSIGFRY
jgi:hypothetical protein